MRREWIPAFAGEFGDADVETLQNFLLLSIKAEFNRCLEEKKAWPLNRLPIFRNFPQSRSNDNKQYSYEKLSKAGYCADVTCLHSSFGWSQSKKWRAYNGLKPFVCPLYNVKWPNVEETTLLHSYDINGDESFFEAGMESGYEQAVLEEVGVHCLGAVVMCELSARFLSYNRSSGNAQQRRLDGKDQCEAP